MTTTFKAAAALLLAIAPCLAQAQAQYRAQLIETSKAWGTVVADFNGDGHDDIFITGHHREDRVWHWTPAGYVPASQMFDWVDRHDCDAADVDRDGRIDIYCAVGATGGFHIGPKELWMQGADGQFRLAANHGADDPYGRGRIPVFFDFNHDGLPDIYLANEASQRHDGQPNHNHVFVNQGGRSPRFAESLTLATGPRGSACVAKGDANGDGWDDLVVCDLGGPAHVYINDKAGNFREPQTPATAIKWCDAKLADMNRDGLDDLVLLSARNQLQVWLSRGDGAVFESVSFQSKLGNVAKALTIVDFNRDGVKDIYVVLQQATCQDTDQDTARDLVFLGKRNGGFTRTQQAETYAGCGHRADTVDGDKVLLLNGDEGTRGPNYIIERLPARAN